MKPSRSHLQPTRAQFSLSMNVTFFRSAPTATCLVAVKGQVAKLFEHVCLQNQRYAVPLAGPASRLYGVSHRLWQRHCEECYLGNAILRLFLLIWFISILVFYFFLCHSLISHHIPKRKKKEKRKIQTPKSRSKSVEACLPNACVCPPVCPTASPKDSSWPIFSPESSLHQNLFCTICS